MTAGSRAIAGDLAPTGVLRASINLGNPVLAQGSASEPGGVTVDIAREIGRRLDLPVELVCVDAARKSFEAMAAGDADLCFLAIEPARETEVAFTAPYVVIEGVFAVPAASDIRTPADVDRPGVRIGVKRGSAYDLYLTRTLRHATVVRGDEGVDVFLDEELDVAAGIRQPMTAFARQRPDVRLIDERFMQIRQAVGTTTSRRPETVAFLRGTVEDLKASGFVAEALRRSGQADATVPSWENTTHDWSATVDTEHLEQVRRDPGRYASGGAGHLVLEVLAYADDEAQALGRRGRVRVTLHRDGSVSVADDGRGTDTRADATGPVKKPVMSTPDLRFFAGDHGVPCTDLVPVAADGTTGTTVRFLPDPDLVPGGGTALPDGLRGSKAIAWLDVEVAQE